MTLLLDCPVEIGLARARRRDEKGVDGGQDRFEQEKMDFHRRVREGYLDLAREDRERFMIIDAGGGADEVEEKIFAVIEPYLDDPFR